MSHFKLVMFILLWKYATLILHLNFTMLLSLAWLFSQCFIKNTQEFLCIITFFQSCNSNFILVTNVLVCNDRIKFPPALHKHAQLNKTKNSNFETKNTYWLSQDSKDRRFLPTLQKCVIPLSTHLEYNWRLHFICRYVNWLQKSILIDWVFTGVST